jgi:hypothetical protein
MSIAFKKPNKFYFRLAFLEKTSNIVHRLVVIITVEP